MLFTSLLKGFSAGCSILKGLTTILNYKELFLVWLLGCACGRAGRKGSGWWSWIMDVHTVPTLGDAQDHLAATLEGLGKGTGSAFPLQGLAVPVWVQSLVGQL